MSEQLQRRFAPVLYIVLFFAGFFTAFLWFDPRNMLDNLAATVTAVAALALVPLAYWFSKLSLQHRQREQLRLEALQQENVRPVLHAVLRPAADAPHLIELALSNHGKGTAHTLGLRVESIAATPAAEAVAAALQALPVFSDGLDMLAAAESHHGAFADFDTLARRFAPAPFNGIIKIVAEYQDIFGNACRNESVLDIAALAARQTHTAPARPSRKKLLY